MKKLMMGGMVVAACAAGLLLTACGGSSAPTAAKTPDATAASTPTPTPAPSSASAPSATGNQYVACLSAGTCTAQQENAIAQYNGIGDGGGTNGCLIGGTGGDCTPSQQQEIYSGDYENGTLFLPGEPNQLSACLSAGTCTATQQEAIASYNNLTDAAGTNGCLVGGGCTSSQQQDIYQSGEVKFASRA
jgi:hypothetical protein